MFTYAAARRSPTAHRRCSPTRIRACRLRTERRTRAPYAAEFLPVQHVPDRHRCRRQRERLRAITRTSAAPNDLSARLAVGRCRGGELRFGGADRPTPTRRALRLRGRQRGDDFRAAGASLGLRMAHAAIENDAPAAIRLLTPHGEEGALSCGLPVSGPVVPWAHRVAQVAAAGGLRAAGYHSSVSAVGFALPRWTTMPLTGAGTADDRIRREPLQEGATYTQRLRGLSERVLRIDDTRGLGSAAAETPSEREREGYQRESGDWTHAPRMPETRAPGARTRAPRPGARPSSVGAGRPRLRQRREAEVALTQGRSSPSPLLARRRGARVRGTRVRRGRSCR